MPKNDSKLKYSKRPSKKSGKAVAPTGVGAKGVWGVMEQEMHLRK
jgi:hypothetical protein